MPNYGPDYLNYLMQYFSLWLGGPANLLQSIAMKESIYNPSTGTWRNVCNQYKACGLMQLKPIALADIKRAFRYNIDPMDPVQAIVGAALMFKLNDRYIRYYTKQAPSWPALIVAYNVGWTGGRYYMQTGRAPYTEAINYLAFVGNRTGVV